jgi:multidrug transporter EmrE-like cation transporter
MNFLPVIILCAFYAALNVSGAALIKSQLKVSTLTSFQDYFFILFKWRVLLGFTIILISALVLFKALAMARFSLVNPVAAGVNFIFTLAVGYWVFNDKISYLHYIGLSLIVAGIITISLAEKTNL